MNSPGSIPPHLPPQGRNPQSPADPGGGLNTGTRGMAQGQTRDNNPQQHEKFGRSLQKAMALPHPTPPDATEDLPAGAAVAAPVLPFLAPAATPAPAPAAEPPRATVEDVAQRIDRYLRGSEAGQSLRLDGGMVVRLPANVLGVTEVSLRLRGDVLLVSIAMQAETAASTALQSQAALLGQALSLRHTRQPVRVVLGSEDEAETRADDPRGFNPLIPRGRIE